jgi:hypothetical protein
MLDSTARTAPGAPADVDHRLGQRPGLGLGLHERAAADLDVEDEAAGTAGELLAHDAARDQRQRRDRAGGVAERVQQAVGRGEVLRLAGDGDADVTHLRRNAAFVERGAEAGDRLELVDRPAGVPEAAPRHLRHARRPAPPGAGRAPAWSCRRPPGRVLVDGVRQPERSRRSPLYAMTSVRSAVSCGVIPRHTTAISHAATW